MTFDPKQDCRNSFWWPLVSIAERFLSKAGFLCPWEHVYLLGKAQKCFISVSSCVPWTGWSAGWSCWNFRFFPFSEPGVALRQSNCLVGILLYIVIYLQLSFDPSLCIMERFFRSLYTGLLLITAYHPTVWIYLNQCHHLFPDVHSSQYYFASVFLSLVGWMSVSLYILLCFSVLSVLSLYLFYLCWCLRLRDKGLAVILLQGGVVTQVQGWPWQAGYSFSLPLLTSCMKDLRPLRKQPGPCLQRPRVSQGNRHVSDPPKAEQHRVRGSIPSPTWLPGLSWPPSLAQCLTLHKLFHFQIPQCSLL